MVNEVREQTEDAIRQLREAGHLKEAQQLESALDSGSLDAAKPDVESEGGFADALPLTLREACQTVLTAIEAIDPNLEMLLEQLRAKIDNLLTPKHEAEVSKDS